MVQLHSESKACGSYNGGAITVRVKSSVRKVSNGREATFEVLCVALVKCLCNMCVLLLEVHDRAAKRISAM